MISKAGQGVSYLLPNLVDKNSKDKINFYFRPREVKKKVEIRLMAGDRLIKSKRVAAVIPSEMINMEVDPGLFEGLTGEIEMKVVDLNA